MRLLYGTTNSAKLESMRRVAKSVGIQIIGLNDLQEIPALKDIALPQIEETGSDPLENATIKARAYFDALGIPLFSCDSGLYFDQVPPSQQPGTHVRRVNGKELSDSQMVEYYANLAARHGGRLTAKYKNAICLILDKKNIFTRMDSSLEIPPFYLVSKPHPVLVKGFPLDSLSVDIASGKYYQDMQENLAVDKDTIEIGFANFFREVKRRADYEKELQIHSV